MIYIKRILPAEIDMNSALKITRYDRSDIESGLIKAPPSTIDINFRSFWNFVDGGLRDTEVSTMIKYSLALSMIKNWIWKHNKYKEMLAGPNGARKLVATIRRQLGLYIKEENSIIRGSGKTLQFSEDAIGAHIDMLDRLISKIESILENSEIAISAGSIEGRYFEANDVSEPSILGEWRTQQSQSSRRSRQQSGPSRQSRSGEKEKENVVENCVFPDVGSISTIPETLRQIAPGKSAESKSEPDIKLPKTLLKYNSKLRTSSINELIETSLTSVGELSEAYFNLLSAGKNFSCVLAKLEYFKKLQSLRDFYEILKQALSEMKQPEMTDAKISNSEETRARELIDKNYPEFAIKKMEQQNIEKTLEYLQRLIGNLKENDLPKAEKFVSEKDYLDWIATLEDAKQKEAKQAFEAPFQKWEELKRIFYDASKDLVGRDAELNSILQIIISFAKNYKMTRKSFLNFALLGPPGTGKTTLAKYIGKIFAASGILITGDFREVTRTTLVSQYLGATAHQTLRALEESREGVLFLDEAYALTPCADKVLAPSSQADLYESSQSKKGTGIGKCPKCTKWDEYGSEALNVIVPYLTNNQGMIVMIVAGYTDDTLCTFYAANVGIPRRFPYTFILKGLTTSQMKEVFTKSVRNISGDRVQSLSHRAVKLLIYILKNFRDDYLPNGIGDIENFANFVVEKSILQNSNNVNLCTLATSFDRFVWNMYGARFECVQCCSGDANDSIPEFDNIREEDDTESDMKQFMKLQQEEHEVKSDLMVLIQGLSDEEHATKPRIDDIRQLKMAISEVQQIHDDLLKKMRRLQPRSNVPSSSKTTKNYKLLVKRYKSQNQKEPEHGQMDENKEDHEETGESNVGPNENSAQSPEQSSEVNSDSGEWTAKTQTSDDSSRPILDFFQSGISGGISGAKRQRDK